MLYSELGRGSFGTVTLAQDLTSDTGEWIVVKEIVIDPKLNLQHQIDALNFEISALREANQYIGKIEIIDVNGQRHIYIAQKLAEGIELQKAVETEDSFLKYIRPHIWINFGFNLVDAYKKQVADIGKNGHINRDLKLGNAIVNPVSGVIYFIDKGMSAPKNSQGDVLDSNLMGTPDYMAPELGRTNKNGLYIYNEKSEIFSLGLMLLKFYQFPHQYNFFNERHRHNGVELGAIDPSSPAMRRFPNDIIRDELYNLLVKMVSLKPEDRPTLAECLTQLGVINNLTLLCSTITKNIAVFDINEYRLTTDPLHKAKMIEELKNADEVWLLDSASLKDEFEYLHIVDELQRQNVRMGNRLFAQPSTNRVALQLSLIKDMKSVVTGQHPDDALQFTYVTSAIPSKAFTEQLNKIGIKHVNINKPIVEQIIHNSWHKHIEALNKDITHLSDKYQGKNTEINQIIEQIEHLKHELSRNNSEEADIELISRFCDLQHHIQTIESKLDLASKSTKHEIDTPIEVSTTDLLKDLETLEHEMALLEDQFNSGNKALETIVDGMKALRDELITDQLNSVSINYVDAEIAALQLQMYADIAISFVMRDVFSDPLTETSILKANDLRHQPQTGENVSVTKAKKSEKDLKQQTQAHSNHVKQQLVAGNTSQNGQFLRASHIINKPAQLPEAKKIEVLPPEQKHR